MLNYFNCKHCILKIKKIVIWISPHTFVYVMQTKQIFKGYIIISWIASLSSSLLDIFSQSLFMFYILTEEALSICAKGTLYGLINFPSIISNIYPKENGSSASLFLLMPWYLSQRSNVSTYQAWAKNGLFRGLCIMPGGLCLILMTNISLTGLQDNGWRWFGSQAPLFLRKINGAYSIMHTFWKNFLCSFKILNFNCNTYKPTII